MQAPSLRWATSSTPRAPNGDEQPDRHFGEEGARLTYGSYLRVAELLDQQRLESDPPAHDELLFITIHQVYELWFKQLLHELTAVRDGDVRRQPVVGAAPAGAGRTRSRTC